MFAELLNKMTNGLVENDLEAQQINNSMTIRIVQKTAAAKISEIHSRYDVEKEQVRNEINNLDDKAASNEYEDLMAELNDLKSEEEREVEAVEQQANDRETAIQLENDNLSTRLEAMKADDEAIDEALQKDIESEFGYFNH